MAWYEGELFPVGRTPDTIGKEWPNAPVGAIFNNEECRHDHVVMPIERFQDPVPLVTSGRVPLHCMDCDERWWEDVANVKGSPWVVK
jgi:hypothetical protein